MNLRVATVAALAALILQAQDVHPQPQVPRQEQLATAPVPALLPLSGQILLAEIIFRRDGTFAVGRVHRRPGKHVPSAASSAQDFYVQMVSYDGQPVGSKVYFSPPSMTNLIEGAHDSNGYSPGEVEELFERTIAVALPVYVQARTLAIYSTEGTLRAGKALEGVLELCGNGRCDAGENGVSCPRDCPASGHDLHCNQAADGVCDPDCVAQSPGNDISRLDSADCSVPEPGPSCNGEPFCHAEQMVICYYDSQVDSQGVPFRKIFQRVAECPPEFPCADGYCGGAIDVIKGYTCRENRDCVVNGVQYVCHCRECKRAGTVFEMCCPNPTED